MREEMEYINGVLEELDAIVYNASGVPMKKGLALVDRADILVMLEELRSALPGELSEAESVRRECSAVVAAAEEKAARTRDKAREEAEGQVEHTDAYLRAERKVADVIESAEQYAREVSSGSEAYRERIMGNLESWCEDSLTSVRESRKELNGAPVQRAPGSDRSQEPDEEAGWQANSA